MTDEELRQLISSNARVIQAAADERVEIRQAILEMRQETLELRQANLRLVDIQNRVTNLLSRLDEDRPTILRKLTTIENKVDQLLKRENENGDARESSK